MINIFNVTLSLLVFAQLGKLLSVLLFCGLKNFCYRKRCVYFSIIINFPAIDNLSGAGDDV